MKKILVALVGLLCFVYLLNPTFGIFELIPDNIPLVGNLDEVTASTVLLAALRNFEWDLTNIFRNGPGSVSPSAQWTDPCELAIADGLLGFVRFA